MGVRRPLLALLLASAWLACGEQDVPAPTPSPTPASAPTPTPAPTTPAPVVPEGDLRGDARAGARVYQQFCTTCHGAGGKGDGPASQTDPRPADHTDSGYMGSLSDAQLYTVISRGGAAVGKSPLMAPWGAVLTDEQIRDVIAHVRGLSGT